MLRAFVESAWLPIIGWVCAVGCLLAFVGWPMLSWYCAIALPGVKQPTQDTASLVSLVCAVVGMGAVRSVDRHTAVTAAKHGMTPEQIRALQASHA